ncbi:MAG TPA: TonB family protein [Caldithrix abyssi]|uniref:TonB family protein n=1 Tax=Caldithrix abyssi TaxID=187145 RepID=A0A7V4U1X8_CALAY|nr:TonB family protein [Caldithrix abyssi]
MLKKYLSFIVNGLWIIAAVAQTQIIDGLRIDQSVHWSGNIIIRGDVHITRNGRLVINPGTRIYFEPHTDLQKSGRDKTKSEIIVEGTIIARGYINNKILFTSNSEEPRMGDWYGITISNPKQISTFEYCTIEYAYNGIYIKKSNPQILNSHLRYNYNAGIIASVKSNPIIQSSIISENGYAGLICELGARPVLGKNLITLNQIGVVSFSMSQPNLGNLQEGQSKNSGENRIFDNQDYNVFNHSSRDVLAQNNYWGSEINSELELKIYGRKNDPRYGDVVYNPILGAKQSLTNLVALAQNTAQTENQPQSAATANQVQNENASQTQPGEVAQVEQPADEKSSQEDTLKLRHRTLDEILGQFAVNTTPQKPEKKAEPSAEKKEINAIDYEQVFLDAFLDERKQIVKKVPPLIDDPTRGLGATGKVIVKVIVGKNGRVESAQVLRGLNYYYDEISLNAAKKFVFKPGTIKGHKVRFSTNLFFEFK